MVTVDIDGDLPFLGIDPAHRDRLKSRSVGQYGPDHGADRLLRVFERQEIPVTWFVPGAIAQSYPGLMDRLVASGGDIASHGMHHLDFDGLGVPDQIDEMLRGRDALAAATGRSIVGFRTPAGEWGPGFVARMASEGFTWSSSIPADDRPFWLGRDGVLEIPFRYELEDLQYLGFNLDPPFPPGQSRIASHVTVRDNWRIEFEAANRWGTMFLLRLNAEIIGTPGRTRLLEQFLEGMRESGSWFVSCTEMRAHWDRVPPEPAHPYALFEALRTDHAAWDAAGRQRVL
ncbi:MULTISPECIES: polysaccharide deacetylase family protein [Streptomyces]|uniref:polysaccharide deacetylase family protein n=1 Tax=Streptomyces lycopersici TaxID=2974589 RepID=UPI0021CF3587|nr:polysaccharide deacetylase family protein [Streptomyces sp. NEAU-383]